MNSSCKARIPPKGAPRPTERPPPGAVRPSIYALGQIAPDCANRHLASGPCSLQAGPLERERKAFLDPAGAIDPYITDA